MDTLIIQESDSIVEYSFAPIPDSIKGDFVKVSLWKQGQIAEQTYQQVLANGRSIAENQAETNTMINKFGIINALLILVVIGLVFVLRKR